MPSFKPCPHAGCTSKIQTHHNACRKHAQWPEKPPLITSKICVRCGRGFAPSSNVQGVCDECRAITCPVCQTGFIPKHGYVTCSKECSAIWNAAPTLTCQRCSQPFKQRRGVKMKYCGDNCRYLAARVDESTLSRKKRGLWAYKQWRTAVFERDNYTCQKCGATKGLHAHHVKQWKDYPELAYSVNNGLTVCFSCHSIIHGAKVTPTGARRKTCAHCEKPIKGKGKSPYCRSCAMKLSPKVHSNTSIRIRNKFGQFAS